MKPFKLFIIACLILNACNKPEHQKEDSGKTGTQNDGITIVTKLFENSSTAVEYEIPVVKGTNIKHGIQKRYYQHGSLYSEIPYVAGKKEGTAYTYYPVVADAEPIVWKEQLYVKDKLEGICKRYHKDGTLQAEYEYKNGLPGTGLKEYYQSGNPVQHPDLILTKVRTAANFYVSAQLSDNSKNADYFIGDLIEGKYLPENLKGLQVVKGKGEILLPLDTKKVTITAVTFTDYKNRYIVSKTITL